MSETRKLIDHYKESIAKDHEMEDIQNHIDESSINTDQEILAIKKELNSQKKKIQAAILSKPFSASVLYSERSKLELVQRKFDAITKIKEELF